jgi:hypothetical protein
VLIGTFGNWFVNFIRYPFKYNKAYLWLFGLFQIAENPDTFDLSPYIHYIYLSSFLFIILGIFLFSLRDKIFALIKKIGFKLLLNQNVLMFTCYYLYLIFALRKIFDRHNAIIISIIMGIGHISFLSNLLLNPDGFLAKPVFWMLLWFTLGVTLISLDQFTNKMFTPPPFNESGFFTKLGTLTAAGQAAIYAGIATSLTAITIASLNNNYNHKENEKNRKQAQCEAELNRKQAHDTAERAYQHKKDLAAQKYTYKTKKQQEDHAEAERIRQHEREKWRNTSWWSKK